MSNKSIGAIFPRFAQLHVSASHFGNSLDISYFKNYYYIYYGDF